MSWRSQGEAENKNKIIADLEAKLVDAELEKQNKARKISELETWMACLTNSTLVAAGSPTEAEELQKQINFVRLCLYDSVCKVYGPS